MLLSSLLLASRGAALVAPRARVRAARRARAAAAPPPTALAEGADWGAVARGAVIFGMFGGGLVPSLLAANAQLLGAARGRANAGGGGARAVEYGGDGDGGGAALVPGSGLLLYGEDVRLGDVAAVLAQLPRDGTRALTPAWADLPEPCPPPPSDGSLAEWQRARYAAAAAA